jgi:hypothetical protein
MRKWMAMAALLMMTACISPEEQAAMDAAQRQADAQECQSLGFRSGSNGFGNCMLKLKEIRAQQENTEEIRRMNTMPSPWWPYGPFGPPFYR